MPNGSLIDTGHTNTSIPRRRRRTALGWIYILVGQSVSEPWFFTRSPATHLKTLAQNMLAVSLQALYGNFLILFSTPGLWRGPRTPIEDFLSFNSGQRLIISISIASCQTSGHDGRKLLRGLAQGQWPFAIKNSHEKFLSFKTTLS